MDGAEWRFLLDENVDRRVATRLRTHGHRVELVVDVLEPGADDRPDVSDFGDLEPDDHEGVILVFDDELGGDEMANGIRRIVDAYPSRDGLRGRETLDPWV
jgi:hypothetical protein